MIQRGNFLPDEEGLWEVNYFDNPQAPVEAAPMDEEETEEAEVAPTVHTYNLLSDTDSEEERELAELLAPIGF